jgi:N-acetylmuramoyl-L-alanine amidase
MKLILIPLLGFCVLNFTNAQVICIDPGHGYGPNGENLDDRTWEEISTNCAVGLLLEDTLTKQGYTVINTRPTNDSGSWMSLTQRAELADSYDSERLLSIHCNGGGGTGTETFWCYRQSPNKNIDSIFSQLVQDNMANYGEWTSRRSVEDNSYLGFHLGVLKGSTPGCLNEIGFVDTPFNLEKLLDENWRKNFAIAYLNAINQSFEIDYPSSLHSLNLSLNCFPNPFSEYLNVRVSSIDSKDLIFEIIDLSGHVVLSGMNKNGDLGEIARINTSALKSGLYFLKVYTNSIQFPALKIDKQ